MTTTNATELNAIVMPGQSVNDILNEYSNSLDFVFDAKYYEAMDREQGTHAEVERLGQAVVFLSAILDGACERSDTLADVVEENLTVAPSLKRKRTISTGSINEYTSQNDNLPSKKVKVPELKENDSAIAKSVSGSNDHNGGDILQENPPATFDEPVFFHDPSDAMQSPPNFHPSTSGPSPLTTPAMGYQPLPRYPLSNFCPPSADSVLATQRVAVPVVHRSTSSTSATESMNQLARTSFQGYSASPAPCRGASITPTLPGPSSRPSPISRVPSTSSQNLDRAVTISNGQLSWAHPPASPAFHDSIFLLYQPPSQDQNQNQRPRGSFIPAGLEPGPYPSVLPQLQGSYGTPGPWSSSSSTATTSYPNHYPSQNQNPTPNSNFQFSPSSISSGTLSPPDCPPSTAPQSTSVPTLNTIFRSVSQTRRLEKIPCEFCGKMITRKGIRAHQKTNGCQSIQSRRATSGVSPPAA